MKILISGGAGFIGSYLSNRLINENYSVHIVDNQLRGDYTRLDKRVKIYNIDLTKSEELSQLPKNYDWIFHLAAVNGTDNFYNHPDNVLQVGVKGAINIIDSSIKNKVKNFIVTSSSEVYQSPTKVPTDEKERLIIPDVKNPRFSYSGAKIITELLSLHCFKNKNIRSIICRPHNFYGPDMGDGHVIPQLINKIVIKTENFKKNQINLKIQGTGNETRSFCYIDDAINGIMKCAYYGKSEEIYNIGSTEEISIKDLVNLISEKLKIKINIEKSLLREGGTKRRCPDIKKISKLDFKNEISLQRGLEETINWYTKNQNNN